MDFLFVVCVYVKSIFSVDPAVYAISFTFSIKLEFMLIGFFLGLMAIIGNFSESETFQAYFQQNFDIFQQ